MSASTTTVDCSALYHGTLTWVPQRAIFLTRAGSHAYGLATPESDLDLRAGYTFSGYAVAQLKRIKTHRRWLIHPPTHKPTRQEAHALEAVAERSPLPPVPDSQKLDALCIAMVEEALGSAYLAPYDL